jgi:hypothetical protein
MTESCLGLWDDGPYQAICPPAWFGISFLDIICSRFTQMASP